MSAFVKSALFAALGVCCLALGSGAQAPPTPTAPAAAQPAVIVGGQGTTNYLPAQGAPVPYSNFTGRVAATDGRMWTVYDGHDGEAHKLAKLLADAKTETDKDKAKENLRAHLVKAFDDRQKRQEKQIAELEDQVKKLKEMASKRSDGKKEIIDDRMKQLEREARGLGW